MPRWDDMVTVGRVARPHGLKGQVVVNPETDFVEARFAPGQVLHVEQGTEIRPLTVASMRVHLGRPIVGFEGFARVEDVEWLAGKDLRVPEEALTPLDEGTYYHHQLVGCAVETGDGMRIGEVTAVEGTAGGSRLIVRGPRGEVQIPLAVDIVPTIDVAARRIVVTPPEGLLDVNEIRATRGRRRTQAP